MPNPKLKYFIQCDEVRNDNGKFSAIGMFDAIFSFIFPATHKKFCLLLGFVGSQGHFDVEIQIAAPNGTVTARANGEINLPADDQVGNVVFSFENFPLPAEGRYTVSVFLDGDFLTEWWFKAQPPFRKRDRTPEEIAMLMAQPDIVKSANVDIACEQCRTVYRFQHNLDPNVPVEPGAVPLPPGDIFACAVCGRQIGLKQLRENLLNIVGIPRQWLDPRKADPAADQPTKEDPQQ